MVVMMMMNAGQANWPTILTHHPLTNGLWEGRVRHEINLPDGSRDRDRERLMDDQSNRLRLLLKGLFCYYSIFRKKIIGLVLSGYQQTRDVMH